ncbi:MAG: efflux RND transporter periplasmic adaptor subunit, partial [Kiritimatiellae bacterium]|nr:efflux RND transporter periplasmic adaptor subunit [Kiritimatiellia bacterium]
MKKIILSLLALLLLAGGWWRWRGRSATQDAPQYQEIAVERGNIRETVLATGTLEPQIR